LIAHFSLSQTDSITVETKYPQVRIVEGDTIFLFTHEQVKDFDKTYTKLDKCNELNKSLEDDIALCDEDVRLCDEQLEIEKNKVELITEIKEETEGQNEILTSENKKQKKKIKLLKKTRTLFTIGGTIIGGVLGYLITK
jgi:hypothetical protein